MAVDLGLNIGIVVKYGSNIDLLSKRFSSKNKTSMIDYIESILKKYKITHVIYEKLQFSTNTKATQAHGAYVMCLEQAVRNVNLSTCSNIIIYWCTPNQAKKALTGTGSASKQAMCYYASDSLNVEIKNDNIADAYGVLRYYEKEISPFSV